MYDLKNNVPLCDWRLYNWRGLSKNAAKRIFFNLVRHLSMTRNHPCKIFFREERDKPMRGRCQVNIGEFFYYVELFKSAED